MVKKLNKEILVKIKNKKAKTELEQLGCTITKEITIGKQIILFAKFKKIIKPKELENKINSIKGVIDNGIFASFRKKPIVIVGGKK